MLNSNKKDYSRAAAKTQRSLLEKNYHDALMLIEQQNQDIQRLISALLMNGVVLPGDISMRYLNIRRRD